MPKPTFFNLPSEKRQRLTDLAIEEFANNDYEIASITQLVAKAGIAKGSVYQYFENKQDWFLFVLGQAQTTMLSSFGKPPTTGDFFVVLRWQMSATIRAAIQHPREAKLIQRAFTNHLPFEATIQKNAKELRHQYLYNAIASAQAEGVLAQNLDPSICLFVIDAVLQGLGHFVHETLALDVGQLASLHNPALEQVFDEVLAVLKFGLQAQNQQAGKK
jgi:AcrR family transcriptional regulator